MQISPVWSLFGSGVRPFLLHLMVFPDALKIGHIDRLKDKQVLTLLCDYVRILWTGLWVYGCGLPLWLEGQYQIPSVPFTVVWLKQLGSGFPLSELPFLKPGQYSSYVQAGCLLFASSTASSPRELNVSSFNIRVFDIGNPNCHLSYAPVIGEFWNQLKTILMWCAYI